MPTRPPWLRPEDLRRFAASLGAAVGLTRDRASALASYLLWYDAAGASESGIATLPDWIERLERGEIDPKSDGRVGPERAGTAVFDAKGGLPPLLMERAARIASEKAREVGVGLVRVTGLGAMGPSAAIVAELAVGPTVGLILGPGGIISLAFPASEGLPIVFDPALAVPSRRKEAAKVAALAVPWPLLVPEGDWLILAVTVDAFEPLAAFRERLSGAVRERKPEPGLLLPSLWESRRDEARRRGVSLSSSAQTRLLRLGERLGVEFPKDGAPPTDPE